MTKEIYKTFEQWMNGNFLEVKEPRKKAYSKDELLLVEMGWKYGYDAGRAVEQALDKKAENARELGLDYEPVLKDNSNYRYDPPVAEPVAYLCENAVGHKYFRWKKPSSTYKPIALYTTPPAQPAPTVQEPVAWMGTDIEGNPNKFRLNPFNGGVELYKKPQSVKVWDAEGYDALMQELELWKAAAQRQWVGLTDEEVAKIVDEQTTDNQGYDIWCDGQGVARAIEAKLKERNNA